MSTDFYKTGISLHEASQAVDLGRSLKGRTPRYEYASGASLTMNRDGSDWQYINPDGVLTSWIGGSHTGLPVTPNGGDIVLAAPNASGVYSLGP